MKKEKKIGFYHKLVLAMSDFRIYPHLLKNESLLRSLWHFVLFIVLLSLIISVKFFSSIMGFIGEFESIYKNDIPNFSVENGVLNVDTNDVRIVQNDLVAIINTDCKYDECKLLEEYIPYDKYKNRMFICSDSITIDSKIKLESGQEESRVESYKFIFNEIPYSVTKDSIYDIYLNYKDSLEFKTIIIAIIFVSVFISYGLTKLFDVFMYSLIAMLYSIFSGMKLNYKNYLKMAIYIVTLPYILEVISIIFLGTVTESVYLITSIVAMVYVVYAIRAIKLDAFLIIVNNPESVKKGKNGRTLITIDPNEEQKEEKDIDQIIKEEKEARKAKKTRETKEKDTDKENKGSIDNKDTREKKDNEDNDSKK